VSKGLQEVLIHPDDARLDVPIPDHFIGHACGELKTLLALGERFRRLLPLLGFMYQRHVGEFDAGLLFSGGAYILLTVLARTDQECGAHGDPRRVFDREPYRHNHRAIDGSWRYPSTQQVVCDRDRRGGEQYASIPIKRQECERDEYVKMRLHASMRQMDEKRRNQHLCDRHGVAGHRFTGTGKGEDCRQTHHQPRHEQRCARAGTQPGLRH